MTGGRPAYFTDEKSGTRTPMSDSRSFVRPIRNRPSSVFERYFNWTVVAPAKAVLPVPRGANTAADYASDYAVIRSETPLSGCSSYQRHAVSLAAAFVRTRINPAPTLVHRSGSRSRSSIYRRLYSRAGYTGHESRLDTTALVP